MLNCRSQQRLRRLRLAAARNPPTHPRPLEETENRERQPEQIDCIDEGIDRELGADQTILERRQEPGVREAVSRGSSWRRESDDCEH